MDAHVAERISELGRELIANPRVERRTAAAGPGDRRLDIWIHGSVGHDPGSGPTDQRAEGTVADRARKPLRATAWRRAVGCLAYLRLLLGLVLVPGPDHAAPVYARYGERQGINGQLFDGLQLFVGYIARGMLVAG